MVRKKKKKKEKESVSKRLAVNTVMILSFVSIHKI